MHVRGTRRNLLSILTILALGGTLLPGTGAEEQPAAIQILGEPLGERSGGIFVPAGDVAYLFGGSRGWSQYDTIFRIDPATAQVQQMDARLPAGMSRASAVWTGEHVYLFGGCMIHLCSRTDQILRYEPITDEIEVMQARLPVGVHDNAAIWTGTYAYVFGGATTGCGFYCGTNVIARYDPALDEAIAIPTTMPASAWWAMSAAWTGQEAYLFGGWSYTGAVNLYKQRDTILRFDPATESLVEMPERLPSGRWATTAVWDGEAALIYARTGQTVRYEPGTAPVILHGLVPGVVCCAQAALVGGSPTFLTVDYRTFTTAVVQHHPDLDFENTAPVPVLGTVPNKECVDGGADMTVDASASTDADGDALGFGWSAIRAPHGNLLKDHSTGTVTRHFPLGTTTATVAVTDGRESRMASTTFTVVDSAPPTGMVTRPVKAAYFLDEPSEALAPLADQYDGPVAIGPITMTAEAADLCGVAHVDFIIGTQAIRVRKAPYEVTVREPLGAIREQHVLVVVRDLSGQETKMPFTFLHMPTRVPVGDAMSDSLHDNVCKPTGLTEPCEALIGPDSYPDW